jgi:hypothetical protein
MAAIETLSPTTTSPIANLELSVDAEHTGIRAAGCGVFALALMGSFVIFNLLMPEALLVILVGSLVTAGAISYFADMRLKTLWPSGRRLFANAETIQLKRHDKEESVIHPNQQVNVLPWRFEVKRNGRVKKGWYVVALALEQDDVFIPVYTFASPDQFDKMPLKHAFDILQPPEKVKAGSGREMRLAGQQRRLHTAEKVREMNGAEMTLPQFEQYIEFLQKNYPSWMLTK